MDCVLVTALSSISFAQTGDFETGNKYYEQGEYQSAVLMYKKVEESGIESASLYYNLGNAYFKSGDLGRAVLYYHRAKRLAPSDPDIASNLEFAGKFTTVKMEGVELNPISTFFSTLVGKYHLKTLGWIASFWFILFVCLLIVKYGLQFQFVGLNVAVMLALSLALVSSGLTTFKFRTEFLDKRAVITAQDASVYSGPSSNTDLEFEGSPGLIVEIVKESGDFYDVLFENKRRGWIKKNLLEVI
jgi:tetratricopeptide (TPR) repeat protein